MTAIRLRPRRGLISLALGGLLVLGCAHRVPADQAISSSPIDPAAACDPIDAYSGPPRGVVLDDYGVDKSPTAVRISSDGSHVAYIVNDGLYLAPFDRSSDPWLASPADAWAASPVWSPDSQFLYFLAATEEHYQVWRVSPYGDWVPVQLTRGLRDVYSLELSKDGSRLLQSRDSKPAGFSDEGDGSRPIVIDAMIFKDDELGFLTSDKRHDIYSFEIASNRLTQVTAGPGHDTDPAWAPDSEQAAFIRKTVPGDQDGAPRFGYGNELWTSSLEDGESRRLTGATAERLAPAWSPDGKAIAFIRKDASRGPFAVAHLAVLSLESGSETILTESLDRDVLAFRFSPDGAYIYFTFMNAGGQHLSRVRLADQRIDHLIDGERYVTDFDVSADGRLVAIVNHMMDLPQIYTIEGAEAQVLAPQNGCFLDHLLLGTKEKLSYGGAGGVKIDAFVTKPLDFDPLMAYPTVLHIHGGPTDQQFHYGFDFFAQFLAANGYVVLEPNPPGSPGRGQAFMEAIEGDGNWGCLDYPDLVRAVDHVVGLGYADPERLAVTGFSYGGFMTNCLITRTPTKFKAAVSGAGHSLIIANFGHDAWLEWYVHELGLPWEGDNMKAYASRSPLLDAGKVVTPTLFMCGQKDWNVPLINSELFYQSLRVRGIETQLVIYPGANHTSNWSDAFSKDYYWRAKAWIDEHIE